MRVVSHFRPGLVALHLWDVEHLTGPLPTCTRLPAPASSTCTTRPGWRACSTSWPTASAASTTRCSPPRVDPRAGTPATPTARGPSRGCVAVLVGNRQPLREEDHRALARIARGGLACGVQLILLDVPMAVGAPVETIDIDDHGVARTSMTGRYVRVTPEARFPEAQVSIGATPSRRSTRAGSAGSARSTTSCRATTSGARRTRPRGLRAPVGFAEAGTVDLVLGDDPPHALIGGPSGSGKTNLIYAWIAALATRYGPGELALYLLDFKEGVSFARFAPGRDDPSWLPHARLVGVNVNGDREFGLALLRFLGDELRRRAARGQAVRGHQAGRAARRGPGRALAPDRRRHRRVPGAARRARRGGQRGASTLLEDLARRGRSQGIHLVLASQDVSGIEALWGRPALFGQFTLRIALPRARRVLAETNDAPRQLPRWHAVINHESGVKHGNLVVRVPNASAPGLMRDEVQHRLPDDWYSGVDEPRTFDGSRSPPPTSC